MDKIISTNKKKCKTNSPCKFTSNCVRCNVDLYSSKKLFSQNRRLCMNCSIKICSKKEI